MGSTQLWNMVEPHWDHICQVSRVNKSTQQVCELPCVCECGEELEPSHCPWKNTLPCPKHVKDYHL